MNLKSGSGSPTGNRKTMIPAIAERWCCDHLCERRGDGAEVPAEHQGLTPEHLTTKIVMLDGHTASPWFQTEVRLYVWDDVWTAKVSSSDCSCCEGAPGGWLVVVVAAFCRCCPHWQSVRYEHASGLCVWKMQYVLKMYFFLNLGS